jgi:5-enolpyruvylshikimate-3-phosphate synthase
VRHEGPPVPSAPHIAMTVRMLRAAGASVEELGGGRPDAWRVRPGRLGLGSVTVEPDLSNAGPFLAAALVTGGRSPSPTGRATACRRPGRSWTCWARWARGPRWARTG